MRQIGRLVGLLPLIVLSVQATAVAEQRIAKLAVYRPGSDSPYIIANYQSDYSEVDEQRLDHFTFKVYEKKEVDARFDDYVNRLSTQQSQIDDLRNTITTLRQNLSDLADVNDALVRRLEELERKAANR